MNPDYLRALRRQDPFEPFRLHLKDGRIYEVKHPDLVMVMNRQAVVGLIESTPTSVEEKTVDFPLEMIARVELPALNPAPEIPLTLDSFRKLRRAEPFRPFRVHLKNLRFYEVPQADFVSARDDYAMLGIPVAGETLSVPDYFLNVAYRDMDRVEMLTFVEAASTH